MTAPQAALETSGAESLIPIVARTSPSFKFCMTKSHRELESSLDIRTNQKECRSGKYDAT